MRTFSRNALSFVACGLLLALVDDASAGTFTSLSQTRSVAIGGQITLTDITTGEGFVATQNFREETTPADFGLFDKSVGLGSLVLDNPLGNGSGAGRAAQTSSFGAEAIRFDGTADVFLSGQTASFDAQIQGSGGASSLLTYSFSVDQSTTVSLRMNSEIGPRSNNYGFSLIRDTGDVVWDQTVVYDANGNELRSFTQQLNLVPGVYNLSVSLTASSFFTNNFGTSGRVLADFAITPVPEADAMMMMGLGLGLTLIWTIRRGASHKDRAGREAQRANSANHA